MLFQIAARVVRRLFAVKVSLVKDLTSPAAVRQHDQAHTYRVLRMVDAEFASTGEVSLIKLVSLVKDLTTPEAVRQFHWAAATRALRMIEASQHSGGLVTLHRSDLLAAMGRERVAA